MPQPGINEKKQTRDLRRRWISLGAAKQGMAISAMIPDREMGGSIIERMVQATGDLEAGHRISTADRQLISALIDKWENA